MGQEGQKLAEKCLEAGIVNMIKDFKENINVRKGKN